MAALAEGARIGRYELVELLGRGAFSQTWRATDGEGRFLAIKVATDPVYAAALAARGGAIRAGSHPALAPIVEIAADADPPHVVSEFLPGASLKEYLVESRPFAPAAAVRILRRILEALAHLHAAGWYHGALKSKNVLLTDEGLAVLTDAEVGHVTRDRTAQALFEAEHGAPPEIASLLPYLPFEDLRASPGEPDPSADLHAAGVLLFEMLTGRVPDLSVEEPWTAPEVQPALRSVLRRLVGPGEDRYESAEACLRDLPDDAIELEEGPGPGESSHLLEPAIAPPPVADPAGGPPRRKRSVRLRRIAPEIWAEVEEEDREAPAAAAGTPKPELFVDLPELEPEPEESASVLERKIVRYHGKGSRRVRIETSRGYVLRQAQGAPVFPAGILRECGWCALLLAAAFLVASVGPGFFEVPAGVAPDPARPPASVKPEWYFLPLYQLSNVAPETTSPVAIDRERMAVLLASLAGLAALALPFWERSRPGAGGRWIFHPLAFAAAAVVVGLGLWGHVHPEVPLGLDGRAWLGGVAGTGLVLGLVWEAWRQGARAGRRTTRP